MPDINYFAILVAAIGAMVVGGAWYGPLFGKLWMQGMGFDPNNQEQVLKMKAAAGPAYVQQFIGSLLMAFVLSHVLWAYSVASPETTGINAGVQGAFWMWLGFILPVKYGEKLWSNKLFKYIAIDLGYYLLSLIVMGTILAVWR